MTAKEKKDARHIYFLTPEGKATRITKWVEGEGNDVIKESSYLVSGAGCQCKAFEFKQSCKHVDMVLNSPPDAAVELSEARKSVRGFIERLRTVYGTVEIPPEPYERNVEGKVTCITIKMGNPAYGKSQIFFPGTWTGRLSENGLKVRMIVE